MNLHRSGEDYLEAILVLQRKNGYVRSLDVAEYIGVTKPSISNATKLLREGGFLTMDKAKMIHLNFASAGRASGRRRNPALL